MIEFDDANGMPLSDISEIESFTGFILPDNIIQLFTSCSGGRIKDDMEYLLNWRVDSGVELDTWIIAVESKETILSNWKHRNYLEDYMSWFNISTDYVEVEFLFPLFDLVDGAIYVAIGGAHNKKIFYADGGCEGIVNVATTIENFYSKLKLFELETGRIIELND